MPVEKEGDEWKVAALLAEQLPRKRPLISEP
jgi:hypothetical protein